MRSWYRIFLWYSWIVWQGRSVQFVIAHHRAAYIYLILFVWIVIAMDYVYIQYQSVERYPRFIRNRRTSLGDRARDGSGKSERGSTMRGRSFDDISDRTASPSTLPLRFYGSCLFLLHYIYPWATFLINSGGWKWWIAVERGLQWC